MYGWLRKQKTDPEVGFSNFGAGSGLTRAIPGARPAGSLRLSKRASPPACRYRVETRLPVTGKTKGPVLRRGLLLYLAVREGFEPSILTDLQ